MSKIYTVIVTYNAEPWLDLCLGSLLDSDVQLDKIIVVDNNSKDSTKEIIKEKYASVDLIEKMQNLGFGKSNNIGIQMAIEEGADYIFLLNQDAWIEKNVIDKLVFALKKNKEYGLVSPIHLNGDGTSLDYNFCNYLGKNSDNSLLSDVFTGNVKKGTPYIIDFVNAAAWMLSVPCIEKVGGFDTIFHHYGEDVDYVNRVNYYDYKVGIVPEAIIYHGRVFDKEEKMKGISKRRIMNGLILLKDINKSFYKCLINFIGYCFKNILKGILQANFGKFKYGAQSLVKFGLMIPKVIKHRYIAKNSIKPFLN